MTVTHARRTFEGSAVTDKQTLEAGWNGEWEAKCGNEFVYQQVRGALFCTVLRIAYSSDEARRQVEARIPMGDEPDLEKVAEQLRALDEATLQQLSVSVHVVQVGGDPRTWAQRLANRRSSLRERRPSSAGESRPCQGTLGWDACQDLIGKALRYAVDPSGFANKETMASGPETTTLAYITKPYRGHPLWPSPFILDYSEYKSGLSLHVETEDEYVIGGPTVLAVTLEPNSEYGLSELPDFSLLQRSGAIGVTVSRASDARVVFHNDPDTFDRDCESGVTTFFDLNGGGSSREKRRMLLDISTRLRKYHETTLPGDYTLVLTYNLGREKTTSQSMKIRLRAPTPQEKATLEKLRAVVPSKPGLDGWPSWTDIVQTPTLLSDLFPDSVEGWQSLKQDPFRFNRLLKYLYAGPKTPEHVIPILDVFASDKMFGPEIAALKAEVYFLFGKKYRNKFDAAANYLQDTYPALTWQLALWQKERASVMAIHWQELNEDWEEQLNIEKNY